MRLSNRRILPAFNSVGRPSGFNVVGDADFLDSDLAGYLKHFGVTPTGPATKRVLVDGGPPPGISRVSIAPGTALYVYEVPTEPDRRDFTDMYNQAVTDDKVDTVNTSHSSTQNSTRRGKPTVTGRA